MDLEEIGINVGNWVDSAQARDYWRTLVNAAFLEPIINKMLELVKIQLPSYDIENKFSVSMLFTEPFI